MPSIGAAEPPTRLVGQGPEGIAQRRAKRALDHDLAGLQDRAPGGMAGLAGYGTGDPSGRSPCALSTGDTERADAAVARQRLRAAGGAQARHESRSDISQRDGRALHESESRSSAAIRVKITSQISTGALRAPLKT
jgi:hypothetical protein